MGRKGHLITDVAAIKSMLERDKIVHNNGCWSYRECKLNKHTQIQLNHENYGLHVISGYLYNGFDLISPLMTLHKCGNGGCWNPEHLKQGLHVENMQDAINDGAFPPSNKTHCVNGHAYSVGVANRSKRGWRLCLLCIADQRKRHKEKKFMRDRENKKR